MKNEAKRPGERQFCFVSHPTSAMITDVDSLSNRDGRSQSPDGLSNQPMSSKRMSPLRSQNMTHKPTWSSHERGIFAKASKSNEKQGEEDNDCHNESMFTGKDLGLVRASSFGVGCP